MSVSDDNIDKDFSTCETKEDLSSAVLQKNNKGKDVVRVDRPNVEDSQARNNSRHSSSRRPRNSSSISPYENTSRNSVVQNFYHAASEKIINKVRCGLTWFLLEKSKHEYLSYKDFSEHWDSGIKLRESVRIKLSDEVSSIKKKLKVQKRTLNWIFNRRRPNS